MNRHLTRRRFLKGSAAGLGLTILGHSGSARGFGANEKLNIALIGVGGRGSGMQA